MVVNACGQLQLLSEALHNLVRPCFKIKNEKDLGVQFRGRMALGSITSTKKKEEQTRRNERKKD